MISIIAQYKRWFEIGTIALVIIGALWGFHAFSERQREIGRNEIRLEWREAEVKRIEAENKLLAVQNAARDIANKEGQEREKAINNAFAANSAALVSLRGTISNQQAQLATANIETLRRYSSTASAVFAECAAEYSEMAKEAARGYNAARTLDQAWPTSPAEAK
jgi:uncharacterized protein YhaN